MINGNTIAFHEIQSYYGTQLNDMIKEPDFYRAQGVRAIHLKMDDGSGNQYRFLITDHDMDELRKFLEENWNMKFFIEHESN